MTPLDHAAHVGQVLVAAAVPWALGGSMASSLAGEPRSTNDIDIALRVDPQDLPPIVGALSQTYLAPLAPIMAACREHGSFNLLRLDTGFKVDLFFLGEGQLDRWQIERRVEVRIPGLALPLWSTSPADVVLRKLWWYRMGGEVSDRQWRDVISVLRAQRRALDFAALTEDAARVDLSDLLASALAAAS
jgi:hypothetical protein